MLGSSAITFSAILLLVLIFLHDCNLVSFWSCGCHRAPLGYRGCLEEEEMCSMQSQRLPNKLTDVLLGDMRCQTSMFVDTRLPKHRKSSVA